MTTHAVKYVHLSSSAYSSSRLFFTVSTFSRMACSVFKTGPIPGRSWPKSAANETASATFEPNLSARFAALAAAPLEAEAIFPALPTTTVC